MSRSPAGPCRVRLEVGGEEHPAVALELDGHHAAIRSPRRLRRHEDARLWLEWPDGARTSLPVVGRAATAAGRAEHLSQVDVTGIEGDWRPFLAYLGPASAASRRAPARR